MAPPHRCTGLFAALHHIWTLACSLPGKLLWSSLILMLPMSATFTTGCNAKA